MKVNKKTIAAVAVTLLLAAALFVGAGAADENADVAKNVTTGVMYDSLGAAIAEVQPGETIQLLTASEENGIDWIVTPGEYTIDLNENTLTLITSVGSQGTETQAIRLQLNNSAADPANYKVTFKDGTIAAGDPDTYEGAKQIACMINSYVTLTLDNVTIDGSEMTREGRSAAGGVYGVYVETGGATLIDTDVTVPTTTGGMITQCDSLWVKNTAGNYSHTPSVTVDANSQLTGDVVVGYEKGWSDGQAAVVEIKDVSKINGNFVLNNTNPWTGGNAVLDFAAGTDFNVVAAKIKEAPAKAQIVMESSDSTKAPEILTFNADYIPTPGEDPAAEIKAKTTQSSGTLVTLTVDGGYEFTIPSTIPLVAEEDGTQPVAVSLNNKATESGKTLKVTLATAGETGAEDTTYVVTKAGSASAAAKYTMSMSAAGSPMLKKDSVILQKSMDSITPAATGTMYFKTIDVSGATEVGLYQGQLSFNIFTE